MPFLQTRPALVYVVKCTALCRDPINNGIILWMDRALIRLSLVFKDLALHLKERYIKVLDIYAVVSVLTLCIWMYLPIECLIAQLYIAFYKHAAITSTDGKCYP